jgi:hypothetical protein
VQIVAVGPNSRNFMVLHPLTTLVCDAQHKNIDVAVRPCRPALARLNKKQPYSSDMSTG